MPTDSVFPAPPTLSDLVRGNAESYSDKVAFDYCRYSPNGEEHSQLTYRELDIKARAIASILQQQALRANGYWSSVPRVWILSPASSGVSTPGPSLYRCIHRFATG